MDLRHRNNVSVMGNGASTLVFSHGFGCNQAMWNYLAPQFGARFRVVMYDLVGAGLSDLNAFDKAKYSTLEGYARDLNELIDEFAIGPVVDHGRLGADQVWHLEDLGKDARHEAVGGGDDAAQVTRVAVRIHQGT